MRRRSRNEPEFVQTFEEQHGQTTVNNAGTDAGQNPSVLNYNFTRGGGRRGPC